MFRNPLNIGPSAILAAGLASCLLSTTTLPGQESPAKPAQASASDKDPVQLLIAQLGSDEFSARESASDKLAKLGLAALAPLEAAAVHPDREVRFRAVRILGAIREVDLKQRLEAFLAGKGDDDSYGLPGWTRFKKAYGGEQAARELFVAMQRADAELLSALERGSRPAAESLATRVTEHQRTVQQSLALSLGQVATMLFIAGDEEVALNGQTTLSVLNFCHQQSLREEMNGSRFRDIPRKMLGALIRRTDDATAYTAMMLANQYNLQEGLAPAVKILTHAGKRTASMTQFALMTVAKLGNESHLSIVEQLLEDKGPLGQMQQNNTRYEVQVRDAALAAGIFLTKQKIKDYFPPQPNLADSTDPQHVFLNIRALSFSSEDDRAAVHRKWAEYKASRKK